jgi:hypothetical protein
MLRTTFISGFEIHVILHINKNFKWNEMCNKYDINILNAQTTAKGPSSPQQDRIGNKITFMHFRRRLGCMYFQKSTSK